MKIRITGIVQGVGFRPFVYRIAIENHLTGYIRNTGDACVEILVEGSGEAVEKFIRDLVDKKPPLAQIHDISINQIEGMPQYSNFIIEESSYAKELSGSVIPPDVAICNECLGELRDKSNPRYNYFFITCTNCGPRFTIIEHLPYDRENTTMRDFPMCDFCKSEFMDPANRRFHAQTVACPKCGPKAYLTTSNGEVINDEDPIREAGRLVSEGYIVAVKGYGGFHVAASAIKDEPLLRLRAAKHRRNKPFAIMARSIEAVKSFAEITQKELELLTSYSRPIVLLKKSDNYYLSDLVSPGLHNVGVMLPYTGLHYMLFDKVEDPAFVMTSANPPNQPIVKNDGEAIRTLGSIVDYFLFHNRRIAHRCDDSVVRVHDDKTVFIRRSRGYSPAPILLNEESKRCVVGLGGELNNTACILYGRKAFLSQHIGDVENVETMNFLTEAVQHLINLTNCRVDAVVCDLHPRFITTRLAQEMAERNQWMLIKVQHHYAHTVALMVEHNVPEIICICCDGYGYGLDGEAWGGEIIFASRNSSEIKRVAHLEKHLLIGGDLATIYPIRMAASILYGKIDVESWLLSLKQFFPHGDNEIKLIMHQLRRGRGVRTTSCGRVLDAVAAILGVCYERTYEGEPAMKLESTAVNGRNVLETNPLIYGSVLKTTELLLEIFERRGKCSPRDLAYSAHYYLANGLATLAIEKALEHNVGVVGFSGGVACNQIFTKIIRETIESAGLRFIVHEFIPPGDGGLSFGQAVYGGFFNP
ncbi:MAG: carbamoyltransferase HypF [Candidatus Bathyarchaeia archaeon]